MAEYEEARNRNRNFCIIINKKNNFQKFKEFTLLKLKKKQK